VKYMGYDSMPKIAELPDTRAHFLATTSQRCLPVIGIRMFRTSYTVSEKRPPFYFSNNLSNVNRF